MHTLAKALASSTALSAANDNCFLRLVRNNRNLTYPAGSTTTPLASGGTYYPFGPLKHVAYGNGLIGTFVFDTDYREIFMQTAMSGVNVQLMSLAFDDVDDLKTVTDSLDSTRNQTFTYDKDYRLLTASGKYGSQSFTYDADGNRLTRVTSGGTDTYSYPSGSNKLTSTSSRSLTYTANGDIATDSRGNSYSYNNRSRYSQLTTSGGTTGYKYNALGQRVSKTVGGATTHYHYDLSGHLIAESNGATGNVIREYAYLGDTPLAQIDSAGSIFYIHNDPLGTPQKMTNSAAAIVWDRIQQPFGEDFTITGTPPGNLRFPGQYADVESGLNHNGFRDYDSSLGRYIQADPIGLRGSSTANRNVYGYAAQNALRFTDPYGLWDVFGLGSLTAGTSGPGRLEGEGIGLAGYNSDTGAYLGGIAAGGAAVGTAQTYLGGFVGYESTTSCPKPQEIRLKEVSVGPLAGYGFGGGSYSMTNENGYYFFVGKASISEHGSVGFGFSTSTKP